MRGWLFDIYPKGGEMVVWLKSGGDTVRLADKWVPSIYLAADPQTIARLTRRHDWEWRFEEKFEKIYDSRKSRVLRIFSHETGKLGRQILAETDGRCRLYNVDVGSSCHGLQLAGVPTRDPMRAQGVGEIRSGDSVRWMRC